MVCVVTLPFDFEGKRRKVLANEALDAIKEYTPDVLVFNNEELRTLYPDLGLLDAFKRVDTQVAEALRKIFM
jgi:cell division protein FtsZ